MLLALSTLCPFVIVGWILWQVRPRRRIVLALLALAMLWSAGAILLALSRLTAGWALQAIAFAGSLAWLARFIRRWAPQQAEITRLRRVAEDRADRVSTLSHEVRTPLAMIKGAADLLLDGSPGPLTPQQRTFLETISQNCERTITLSEDLLTQARIEAGLFNLRIQPVDLITFTRQVVRSMRPLVSAKQQTIHVHAPQILPLAQADPGAFQQIITNLLHNASRYTTMGGHIYVSLSHTDEALTVAVTDDGCGMSLEERRRLFQKFASGRPLGDGTGLGLVISQQIVEHHGGRILVDTSLGQGTTILFTLPLWQDAPTESKNG